jgi:hypothetical protein
MMRYGYRPTASSDLDEESQGLLDDRPTSPNSSGLTPETITLEQQEKLDIKPSADESKNDKSGL